ncbi:pilus assembly protein HicB [Alienimonas californiensis]|uniref:HicB family protein n=1 Tax=Alienimonas californiensis TaxID=2527989 RepID=A0A517P7N8_9PLAN|nr:pilus assembly protein HicB [Alienimonas californiensis]QDT15382.1 hypothetical protein CA12_14670 [Alienimonas californiensis]
MKAIDRYPHWVRWNDEDGVYVGRCPDLFRGGVHGDDPVAVFEELRSAMADCLDDASPSASPWPDDRSNPGRDATTPAAGIAAA